MADPIVSVPYDHLDINSYNVNLSNINSSSIFLFIRIGFETVPVINQTIMYIIEYNFNPYDESDFIYFNVVLNITWSSATSITSIFDSDGVHTQFNSLTSFDVVENDLTLQKITDFPSDLNVEENHEGEYLVDLVARQDPDPEVLGAVYEDHVEIGFDFIYEDDEPILSDSETPNESPSISQIRSTDLSEPTRSSPGEISFPSIFIIFFIITSFLSKLRNKCKFRV